MYSNIKFWRFKVEANPTKCVNKQKLFLFYEQDRREWLERKMTGCKIHDCIETGKNEYSFFHKIKKVPFKSVIYEGIIEITDKEEFFKMLGEGIGREKAFGMGLITLLPVNVVA